MQSRLASSLPLIYINLVVSTGQIDYFFISRLKLDSHVLVKLLACENKLPFLGTKRSPPPLPSPLQGALEGLIHLQKPLSKDLMRGPCVPKSTYVAMYLKCNIPAARALDFGTESCPAWSCAAAAADCPVQQ